MYSNVRLEFNTRKVRLDLSSLKFDSDFSKHRTKLKKSTFSKNVVLVWWLTWRLEIRILAVLAVQGRTRKFINGVGFRSKNFKNEASIYLLCICLKFYTLLKTFSSKRGFKSRCCKYKQYQPMCIIRQIPVYFIFLHWEHEQFWRPMSLNIYVL